MSESNSEKIIHIDSETLKIEIEKIRQLAEDKELRGKVDELLIALKDSKGESASELEGINADLFVIVEHMNTLFSRTVEFLENTKTNFVNSEKIVSGQLSGQDN